ncbi:acyl-CoA hydrolase [Chlamydoabsidia padenii]|nr:acyl-CoA hydrolase [Chlamydoabsidia padenii]
MFTKLSLPARHRLSASLPFYRTRLPSISIPLCRWFSSEHNESPSKVYTVRPVSFWMDKIIHHENKKNTTKKPTKERVLIEKTMAESHMDFYLPFKSSPELLEEYIFVDGRIRTGKLLEDLDALAGAIAYKHIDNNDPDASPVTIVTASVDRLDLFLPKAVENYRLSGNVTYVGNSSMEIFIKGEIVSETAAANENKDDIDIARNSYLNANTVLATRFTMVAVDSCSHKPVKINPLRTTSPAEERLRDVAKMNKRRKKKESESSLARQAPTAQESLEMHDMFLESSQYVYNNTNNRDGDDFASTLSPDERRPLPDDCVWMSDTRRDTLILCHAQFRNVHNNIFGGFIMKKALELSFATASTFLRSKAPIVLSMDGVTFRKPVFVGSLLSMKAGIVYAPGYPHRSIQVRVVAAVIDIEKNTKETTNVFYFTLSCTDDHIKVPRVLPRTYAEIMLWLDGRRRRIHGMHARQLLLEDLGPLPGTGPTM